MADRPTLAAAIEALGPEPAQEDIEPEQLVSNALDGGKPLMLEDILRIRETMDEHRVEPIEPTPDAVEQMKLYAELAGQKREIRMDTKEELEKLKKQCPEPDWLLERHARMSEEARMSNQREGEQDDE